MTVPSSPGTPAPAVGGPIPATRIPLFTADAWAPLKVELFRSLWIATSIAQIGTWTREAAGPILMENLTGSPVMVANVLKYSNLPICLFSVFAGALADVLDRRQLLIVTQIWMVIVSTLLGLLTYFGHITPGGLLALTFLLGMGTAAFGPALQAVLPELVPKEQFALAINMNSIALNVARALGPATFILVITAVPGNKGAGVSFILTAITFVGAIWVFYKWKRPPQKAGLVGEGIWNGIRAGFRYTIHSPANRAILIRVLTFIVPAVVIWSQVPIIATRQLGFGIGPRPDPILIQKVAAMLFAFVGMGAILGVFLMPGLHARYKIDPVVNVCTAFFALGLIALSFVHTLWLAAFILVFLGVNWVIIPTNFNTATQKSVPPWVKGRAISFYLTVLFGSFSLGAAIWGPFTKHYGIHETLLIGGLSMLVMLVLARWFPLTLNEGKDLGPAFKAPPEELFGEKPQGEGAVQIAVRYRVPTHRHEGFQDILHDIRHARLRNGASTWRLERSATANTHGEMSEIITYSSWQQYTRSFSRATKWDLMLEGLVKEYHVASEPPAISEGKPHWIFPPIPFLSGEEQQRFAASIANVRNVSARSTGMWLQDRLADGVDRAIDEVFVAYDRMVAVSKRRSASRRVTLEVPTSVRDDKDADRSK